MHPPTLDSPNSSLAVPKQAPAALLWGVRLIALVAVAIAGYLLWASVTSGAKLAGCADDGGFGCDAVLSSRWSSWLGLPVGLPAVIVYLILFAALWGVGPYANQRTARDAWRLLIPLATLAAGAASWFSALQLFELHKMCPYCVGVHSCGIALAAFVFWYAPLRWTTGSSSHRDDPVPMRPSTAAMLLALGLGGVGVLIGGQALGTAAEGRIEITETPRTGSQSPGANIDAPDLIARAEPPDPFRTEPRTTLSRPSLPNSTPPKSVDPTVTAPKTSTPKTTPPVVDNTQSRPKTDPPPVNTSGRRLISLTLPAGKTTIDAYQMPILGSPDANVIIVEMFDYTCHHCRHLHHLMEQARQRYGSQLAIVLLPNPMNSSCNRYVKVDQAPHREACHYARLALAVWNAKPKAFEQFHEWLMDPTDVPSVEDARDKAAELIGEELLSAALADKKISRQIEADGQIYHEAGHGAIPKLMTEKFVAAGQPQSAEQLYEVFETQLGLTP